MDITRYICPNCCADLKWDAAKQTFLCDFCDSTFSKEEMDKAMEKKAEKDESLKEKREEFAEGTALYSCSACGAEIISDTNTAATFCYYCHNPVILKGRLDGNYRPSKVIPFQIEESAAKDLFREWAEKKKFIPKDFKTEQQLEKMTGLYVPFWVSECDVNANMEAIGKIIRTWTSGDYRYTETKEYKVTRRANLYFDGIPADGSQKIEDELMEAIEPFNYKQTKNFNMAYLSGFFADKYDVDRSAVFPRIRNRAVQGTDAYLRSTMKYSSLSVINSEVNVMRSDMEYMLLPVWFMTYQYKGKTYEFAINGQTGKLAGTPPLDKGKLARFCLALSLGLAVGATLLGGIFTWLS